MKEPFKALKSKKKKTNKAPMASQPVPYHRKLTSIPEVSSEQEKGSSHIVADEDDIGSISASQMGIIGCLREASVISVVDPTSPRLLDRFLNHIKGYNTCDKRRSVKIFRASVEDFVRKRLKDIE